MDHGNQARDNIVGVIHNGDIINVPEVMEQWDWASKAMATLEQPIPGYPAGLPYIIAIGNHDQEPMGAVGNANEFNRRFGVARLRGAPTTAGTSGIATITRTSSSRPVRRSSWS